MLLFAILATLLPSPSSGQVGSDARILGVSPTIITPGEPVRIYLSGIKLDSLSPDSWNERLSVLIGGRNATIKNISSDAIVVAAPANLPADTELGLQVVGMGLKLEGPLIRVEPSRSANQSVEAFTERPVFYLAFASLLLLLSIATFTFLFNRTSQVRQLKMQRTFEQEIANLKFLLDQQVRASEPAKPAFGPIASDSAPLLPAVPDELIDVIHRGECTLFWGGGLSAQAGYPTWREGLMEMIQRLDADPREKVELQSSLNADRKTLVIETLATRVDRNSLMSQLSQLWGSPRSTTAAMKALAKLEFANAVTCVWDPLIEQAFAQRSPKIVMGVSNDSLESLLTREAFCIVRLWGTLSKPLSVLLTANEYRAAVAGNPTFAKYVASLALSQSHFFVGTSIETIEEYLSATPRAPSTRTHYALVPEDARSELTRQIFKERYGVELLVFRPTPGWPELATFVDELVKAVQGRAPVTSPGEIESILLKRLDLENIGPFRTLSLELDANWNVLLGNNGLGKSIVLRAIALVLCGDDSRALIEGSWLLRADARGGFVQLTVGADVYRTGLARDSNGVVHVNCGTRVAPLKTGRWMALAFPPLRGFSGENPKGPTAEGSPRPLIEDVLPILAGQGDTRVSNLKQWLINLEVRSKPGDGVSPTEAEANQKLRDHFFQVFNAFVPGLDVQPAGVDRKTWQVNVRVNGNVVSIDQVSQGTSSLLGWVGALLQRLYEINGPEKDIQHQPAVVLIDEIDAHLHPDWQWRIIGTLSEQFRAVQFIATTHSPLIVGELERHQVYRMERRPDGEVVAYHPRHSPRGLGVAGLLTSEMFDLTSTVDTRTHKLLEKQRSLSIREELTESDQEDLENVNKQLEELGFRHQMRDPEYTEYLKQRQKRMREEVGPQNTANISQSPSAAVRNLIEEVVARTTGAEK